jgi:hypothetical protein
MVSNEVRANRRRQAAHGWLARGAPEPGHRARLLARAHARRLDEALIGAADPSRSPQLAARAAALTGRRSRAAIADGLERLLQAAEGRRQRQTGVLPRAGHVLANGDMLHELAGELRGTAPLYARGIAIVNRLLTDGTGPVYLGDSESLAHRLGEARAAMRGAEIGRAR